MKDNIILYPIIYKSDFLHTKYKLTPNDITLLNNLIITPLTLYFLYENKLKLSLIFLYLRSIFDGIDGYIARKYKKYSQLGEVYDHVSDSIYTGFIILFCLNKVNKKTSINNSISFIIAILSMIINFNQEYKQVGKKIFGAEGNTNTFSTIINILPILLLNNNKFDIKNIYEKIYLQKEIQNKYLYNFINYIKNKKNIKSYLLH